jgi:hypothetical protein
MKTSILLNHLEMGQREVGWYEVDQCKADCLDCMLDPC